MTVASRARDRASDRVVGVRRHPRAGREIAAFGGPARFRGKRVLDIGTGNGRLALDVARYARSVTGIDVNEDAIRAARRRAEAQGIRNVTFRVGSAERLDAIRESYDLAIFSWSL